MIENLDKHHLSYSPPKVELILHKEHQRIHGNIPIVSDLNLKMREYDQITRACIAFKNYRYSFTREFGIELPNVDIVIKGFEDRKRQILVDVKVMLKKDLNKVIRIKGLGLRLLAGILAYAHPNRFPSLRKFLHYCGYKQSSRKTNRYSRNACAIAHQMATSVIRCKDPKYYEFYRKIKKDLRKKHKDYRPSKIDGMAKNRLATFLLKEIYSIFGRRNSGGLKKMLTPVGGLMGNLTPELQSPMRK